MGSEPSKLLKECNPNIRYITGFGHMGDGNLHLNVATEIKNDEFGAMLNEYIFSWCRQNGCSISAEHGLGVAKPNAVLHSSTRGSVRSKYSVGNGILAQASGCSWLLKMWGMRQAGNRAAKTARVVTVEG
ncbi:D-2-hydroxyglutarate dehydrogenase, mitochondrial [Zancudomyces culisetae]|uniref:D-2-hydroxyglutarate dehydrogenase, mitochondrial n=1 Tax=Zancudomyces culisetae TaxID=1213189 RepID=A0A1R1PZF4_ZANCU|nr:D-2-hydroxyglutarate dehydrogenase, mitochondrial [Zancudomyces culisetae]|eukprot:OMH86315.1 D-2-hydroxyglutarate dehydrogenase, mitochondrial [Zancudomyces culisetae]